jgi:hypothetical protein
MGASRCTAVGVVTKLMDMKSTLDIGIVSCKIPGNSGRKVLIDLLKAYYPGDFRVTPNKSNCIGLVRYLEPPGSFSAGVGSRNVQENQMVHLQQLSRADDIAREEVLPPRTISGSQVF